MLLRENGDLPSPAGSVSSYPFFCPVCKERYRNPKLIPTCFHSVCDGCVEAVTEDSIVNCPQCISARGSPANQSGIHSTSCSVGDLKDDRLLQHLLQSTGEENVQCANCDTPSQSTYFCHTCCQPLCQSCRVSTHAAKMFSSHNIVLLENRCRDSQPMSCPTHDKLFIMFSVEDRRLICINCFRDMDSGSRSQCMDIESAYAKSSAKLKGAIVKLQQLDRSVGDAIEKVEALVDETEANATNSKETINELITSLMEQLRERKKALLEMVEKQKRDKIRLFQRQLTDLRGFCPVIQASLETSNVFSSATNRYEFLDLVNDMTERLDKVAREPHRLFPIQSSQISCNYRLDIAKTVDQQLTRKLTSPSSEEREVPVYHTTCTSPNSVDSIITTFSKTDSSLYWQTAAYADQVSALQVQLSSQNCSVSHSTLAGNDVVSEQCHVISLQTKALQQRLDNLKKCVQNLHRDLTHRKCQPKSDEVAGIHQSSHTLDADLQEHHTSVCKIRATFEARWSEMLTHIDKEREHYQSLVEEVNRLSREHSRVTTIAKSMEPYVRSLSAVSVQINPRLGEVSKDWTQAEVMSSILEKITSTQPNSLQRVEAIRTAEDLRDSERRRNNALEDNLIKTKEKLKSRPSRRSESFHGSVSPMISSPSEPSTCKEPSMEA